MDFVVLTIVSVMILRKRPVTKGLTPKKMIADNSQPQSDIVDLLANQMMADESTIGKPKV